MEENSIYTPDMERFLKEHPEIDPAWAPMMAPAIMGSKEAVFSFIISYVFM